MTNWRLFSVALTLLIGMITLFHAMVQLKQQLAIHNDAVVYTFLPHLFIMVIVTIILNKFLNDVAGP